MKYYADKYGYEPGRWPEATRVSDESIALPVGWHIGPEDIAYIAQAMKRVIEACSLRCGSNSLTSMIKGTSRHYMI